VPHGIFRVSNTILYENEFQNPQIFQQTISLFPERSTLKSAFCQIVPFAKKYTKVIMFFLPFLKIHEIIQTF
jgi:hypothetical protein